MEPTWFDPTPTPTTTRERAAAGLLTGILGLGIVTGCSVPTVRIEPRITNATNEDVTVVLDIPKEHRTEATLPPGGSLEIERTSVPRHRIDRVCVVAWRTGAPDVRTTFRLKDGNEVIRIERVGGGITLESIKASPESGQ